MSIKSQLERLTNPIGKQFKHKSSNQIGYCLEVSEDGNKLIVAFPKEMIEVDCSLLERIY